ncbi:MAG TPA: glycosyltransferase [Actinomycetota bacterium]|nr:glycosyltransferase [Actinomycetota bacterium]
MTGPLATVVVLNYNGAHLFPDCLRGLAAQDLPEGQAQTWVVDNASSDGSLELLADEFPWVRVIANGRNDGFAGGNNVALREVSTPFVALVNNDARPEPDWLRRLLEPFSEPGAERLGAVSGKIVFLPRFLAVELATPGFLPGTLDTRELGVRVYRVEVDGADVTERVLWDRAAYGPEGEGPGRFRWTRPSGLLLIPVDRPEGDGPLRLRFRVAAETTKAVELTWAGGSGGGKAEPEPVDLEVEVPAGVPLVDVLNNAGSMVFRDGYGADRAYQELDRGQYQRPEEVFAFCGGSVCFRTEALRQAGVFDDDFFLYYEDTDLSWRLRSLGWRIRYQPAAVARHIHSASSVEWSPLFVFHTDRNRLLMLTKNARAGLAAREVLRYPLTTASLALREVARSRHTRRRPPVRPTLLRLRVLGSYLRLLPVMLVRRRRIAARAAVDRRRLERWLVLR